VDRGYLRSVDELLATAERVAALRHVPDKLGSIFEPTRRALKAIELRLYAHAIGLASKLWEAGTEEIQ
jgi:hypothetical protein